MFGIDDLIGAGLKILDKVIPDPTAKAEAQLKLLQLKQAGEFKELEADLQMAQGQIDINKEEAKSPQLFVSGWRPFVGWTCGFGFFYMAVFRPISQALLVLVWPQINFPAIETEMLFVMLANLLGFGGYRTFERVKGKA